MQEVVLTPQQSSIASSKSATPLAFQSSLPQASMRPTLSEFVEELCPS